MPEKVTSGLHLDKKYSPVVDSYNEVLGFHPELAMFSGQMAKYKKEFWHSLMVPTVFKDTVSGLHGENLISENLALNLEEVGYLGAHLHDIGKFAIVNGSIERSIMVMDWVPEGNNAGDGTDQRPPGVRALQHLHPLLGGYMTQIIAHRIFINKRLGFEAAEIVFGHHDTVDGGHKPPYPARINGRRLIPGKEQSVLANFLVMLSDAAVSMREKRAYRDELDFKLIEDELRLYLEDEELIKFVLPLFNVDSPQDLKEVLLKHVLSSAFKNDSLIRDLPEGEINILNEGVDIPEEIEMTRLIDTVWYKHHKRLAETFMKEFDRVYNHTSRQATVSLQG